MKKNAPYGTWKSPISASEVASKSTKIGDCTLNDGRVFWCQNIAEEKGRTAVLMNDGEKTHTILPRPLSAKSKVHEYGGAAYAVNGHMLYFVLADDQRVYQLDFSLANREPIALTPDMTDSAIMDEELRFADLVVDTMGDQLIAVCEHHHPGGVDNKLVLIPLDASQTISDLASGHDFYSNPRISPNNEYLTWITWDHPDMPWDNTQLWIGKLARTTTKGESLSEARVIAGGKGESICQPLWSPDNDLYFISDRNNWWNIFTINHSALESTHAAATCKIALDAEFATPPWVFGMSNYGFISPSKIIASFTQNGSWQLAEISMDGSTPKLAPLQSEFTVFQNVSCEQGKSVFIAASASRDSSVRMLENGTEKAITSAQSDIDEGFISRPLAVTFPSSDNGQASALFYSPQNKDYECDSERPPLIVICHGGPTGATESSLNLKIQYWTSRGFAVADVNYRGSTGYGRQYRQSLFNKWGVYDVDDVCAVVDYLAEKNLVDRNRSIIKGSSAGGYTVLAALAFRHQFSAGVSLYGIGDLEMLAKDTHKFEARYLDKLIGPYPKELETYQQRSPIHAVHNISCPLLIFQGLMDKVVPPNQAHKMFSAVQSKGLPVAYVTYEDEAHGFREKNNIVHMMESELFFYARVFKLSNAEIDLQSIKIFNLGDE